MINTFYYWCVDVMHFLAKLTNTTYEEINIIVFVNKVLEKNIISLIIKIIVKYLNKVKYNKIYLKNIVTHH